MTSCRDLARNCAFGRTKPPLDPRVQACEHTLCGPLDRRARAVEKDPNAPPSSVKLAPHQAVALRQADKSSSLLGEPRARGEFAHAQADLLEEEMAPSRTRTHLRKAFPHELGVEEFVPALRRLGEQVAQVLAGFVAVEASSSIGLSWKARRAGRVRFRACLERLTLSCGSIVVSSSLTRTEYDVALGAAVELLLNGFLHPEEPDHAASA